MANTGQAIVGRNPDQFRHLRACIGYYKSSEDNQHLHKDHLENLTITSSLIDFALPMANPIAKLVTKPINAVKRKLSQVVKASINQIREVLSDYLDCAHVY